MPQFAIPSDTLAAAIRAYLGLTQAELAAYLGVTGGRWPMPRLGGGCCGTRPAADWGSWPGCCPHP